MWRTAAILILISIGAACSDRKPSASNAPATLHSVRPILTTLVGKSEIVIVRAGPREPTYSLQTNTGQVLVADATLTELQNRNDEIAHRITSMLADHAAISDVDIPEPVR